jgi:hypothetical protein
MLLLRRASSGRPASLDVINDSGSYFAFSSTSSYPHTPAICAEHARLLSIRDTVLSSELAARYYEACLKSEVARIKYDPARRVRSVGLLPGLAPAGLRDAILPLTLALVPLLWCCYSHSVSVSVARWCAASATSESVEAGRRTPLAGPLDATTTTSKSPSTTTPLFLQSPQVGSGTRPTLIRQRYSLTP